MSETISPVDIRLSRTEAVLLHADRFAPADTVLTVGEETLLGRGKVAVRPLGEAILSTALLANVEAGAVRLEVRPRKALFGLLTRRPLVAEPTGSDPAWPDGSLERSVLASLGNAERDASDLLVAVLEEDTGDPVGHACVLVRRGLHARGLLESREKKVLKVITTTELVPAPGLAPAAEAHGWSAERNLLDAWERTRPEEWTALKKAISSAISRRTERDSDTDWND